MEIAHLFSTPVFATQIPGGLSDLETIKTFKYIPAGKDDSKNAYMTENTSVLDFFPNEKEIFLNKFNEVKNDYLRHTDIEFVITRSWGTKVEKNCYTQFHKHTNNYYSGVFYLDGCTGDSAPIEFLNPLFALSSYELNAEEYNTYNLRSYRVNLEKNTLIFFPSYLMHKIGTHLSETPRHSIAFNLHPTGKYGNGDSTVNLVSIK